MPFHTYAKPVDYILPRAITRSNFIFDADRTAGAVHLDLDYRGGVTSSTFTAPDGTLLNGFPTDRGIKTDGSPDCWSRFIGAWEIQSNKARTIASGAQTISTEATYSADIDISVDVSATVSAGMYLRKNGNDLFRIYLDIATARLQAVEIFNFGGTLKLTGSTPIVSGTTYTVRVTTSGTTFNVYLNGALEGTFTSTVNQTTGVAHGLLAIDDTAARFDNYHVAKHNNPAATTYTVRNYDGDVVASGAISGNAIDIADSSLTWRGHGPYGWYRMYLTGPDHGDGQWGTAYGDCTFMRIPNSNLSTNGTLTQQASWQLSPSIAGAQGHDEIGRAVMGMGTGRYAILDSSVAAATTIAAMLPAVALAKTWQTDTASAARPRQILIAFPNGTNGQAANVTAIVNGLKSYVKVWEGRNEPNFTDGPDHWTTTEFTEFYNAVKAGDPTAIVIGPGAVSFNDSGIFYYNRFFAAGGAAVSDAISAHPYNCYNGDLASMRYTLGHLLSEMAAGGASSDDMWMTEQGFGWAYAGVVWPHYSTRWTSLMYFAQSCITADRMRPETTCYWYDVQIGFDNFPMQWLLDCGPGPTVGPVRTMSAEIFNKTFTSELDFGVYGQNIYVGGIWTNAISGDKVIGIQASSYGCNPVRFHTTGASSFTSVDPWGNTTTLSASNGDISVPVTELPQWVRVPAGTTAVLEPADWSWGTNACLAGTPATSATNYTGLAGMINGIQENHYVTNGDYVNNDGFRAVDSVFPQTVEVTFASQAINRVLVFCHAPWQEQGTLADFDLQTFDGATWTTRKTWTGDLTRSFHFTSGAPRCVVETYWHDQYIFDYQFPSTLNISGVRLFVRNASYTGFDTKDTSDTGNNGQNGWGPYIPIREFQAFNPSAIPVGPAGTARAVSGVTASAVLTRTTGTSDAQHAANLQAMRPYVRPDEQAAIDRAVALLAP